MGMINLLDSDLPKTRQERLLAEAAAAATESYAAAAAVGLADPHYTTNGEKAALPTTTAAGGAIPVGTLGRYKVQSGEDAQFYQVVEWDGNSWEEVGPAYPPGGDAVATQQAALAVAAQLEAANLKAQAEVIKAEAEALLATGFLTKLTLGELPLDAAPRDAMLFADHGGHVGFGGMVYVDPTGAWRRGGGASLDPNWLLAGVATNDAIFAGMSDVVAVVTPSEVLYYGRTSPVSPWSLLLVESGSPSMLGGSAYPVLKATAQAAGASPFNVAYSVAALSLAAPNARQGAIHPADFHLAYSWLDDGSDKTVMFRATADRQTGWGIERHWADAQIRLVKWTGGVRTSILGPSSPFTAGQTYRVSASVIGNVYKVWVNGVLKVNYTDPNSDYANQTQLYWNPDNAGSQQAIHVAAYGLTPNAAAIAQLDHLRRV